MQWERDTYSFAFTHFSCFWVFLSNPWQEFVLPGALHCVTPSLVAVVPLPATNRLGGIVESRGRALLGAWSGLQTVTTQAIKMHDRATDFLQAGATFLRFLPPNNFVPREETAVASSCYKHLESLYVETRKEFTFILQTSQILLRASQKESLLTSACL